MKRAQEVEVAALLLPFDIVYLIDDHLWPSYADFVRWKATCSHYWQFYREQRRYVDRWLLSSAASLQIPARFLPKTLETFVSRDIITQMMGAHQGFELGEQTMQVLSAVLECEAIGMMRAAEKRVRGRGETTLRPCDLKPVPLSDKKLGRIGMQYVCSQRGGDFLRDRPEGGL
jgi:hypothetical protein